jgi:hypothetical protein
MTDQDTEQVDRVRLEVGSEGSPYGRTEVSLDAGGHVEVRQTGGVPDTLEPRRPGKDRDGERTVGREGEIPAKEAREVLDRIGRAIEQVAARSPGRTALPDETLVRWELDTPAGPVVNRTWMEDAEQDPVLGPAVRRLRAAVNEVGGGEIVL